MDADSDELSSSIGEWRVNLQKSWQNFMDSFITIRRRDETAVPLLAPNQDVYLRENIRSRLLVAAQAVPRHQEETYKQALENVSTGYALITILKTPLPRLSLKKWISSVSRVSP